MTNITIPPEALEAVAQSIAENSVWTGLWEKMPKADQDVFRRRARAAIRAALAAWPGMAYRYRMSVSLDPQEIILPLTENTDAEA